MSDNPEYPPSESIEVTPECETAVAIVPHEQSIRPTTTAAQAKVEAVANLTLKAYERAATLTLAPEESAALQADFPDEAFKPGAAGKENLIYIEHAFLRDRLTQVFGMGQWAIVPRNRWAEDFTFINKYKQEVQASRVYVEAMLVIRGCFVGEAVGDMVYYKNNESQNYGDAVEGAKTAALRRCAKEFGIGLQAWKKDWCAGWWERKNAKNRPAAPGCAATSPSPSAAAPPPRTAPAKPKAPLTIATANTRAAALDRLGCQEEGPAKNFLHSYLVALGWLENDKSLEQWPLRFVPLTAEELEALRLGLTQFSQNGLTVMPYQPHGLDPAKLQGTPVTPVTPPAPEPEWAKFPMPFGKSKGTPLGKFPETELKFYVEQFKVKESIDVQNPDGTITTQALPPESIASQKLLRAALDEAAAHFAKQPKS